MLAKFWVQDLLYILESSEVYIQKQFKTRLTYIGHFQKQFSNGLNNPHHPYAMQGGGQNVQGFFQQSQKILTLALCFKICNEKKVLQISRKFIIVKLCLEKEKHFPTPDEMH